MSETNAKIPYAVRLYPEQIESLRDMAKKQKTTVSNLIRVALFGSKNEDSTAA